MTARHITPAILALIGLSACETVDAVPPQPITLPQELVEALTPQPPPAPPAVVTPQKRAGRTGGVKTNNAAHVYDFDDDRVYPVTLSPGKVTVLQLGKGEQLVRQPMLGDPDKDNTRWFVETTRGVTDFVIVRCGIPSSKPTNLFFATSTYDYQLDLTCRSAGGWDRVRWTYPVAPTPVAPVRQAPFDPNAVTRTFEITNPSGDRPIWTPVRVYENSGWTFIEFPPRIGPMKEAPSLTTAHGKEVPYVIVGGHFYKIDYAITDADLRLDQSVVHIKRIG